MLNVIQHMIVFKAIMILKKSYWLGSKQLRNALFLNKT